MYIWGNWFMYDKALFLREVTNDTLCIQTFSLYSLRFYLMRVYKEGGMRVSLICWENMTVAYSMDQIPT